MDELDHEARCARWLARELIRKHSLPKIASEWADLVGEIYLERVDGSDSRQWEVPEGTHEALEGLDRDGFRLAILTGVPEAIARLRLEHVGLNQWFPRDQGAFGCQVEERNQLIRLALRRAAPKPEGAVPVGDTSRDVKSPQDLGLRVVVVGFDAEPPAAEEEADGVVRTMPRLVETLRHIRDGLS